MVGEKPILSQLCCTRGATAVTYIVVLGLVALVGGIAFGQFEDSVRLGIQQETRAASQARGEDVTGPVGSLAAEVANAGTEQLAVQGAWALAAKAGKRGLASARRTQRGRGALAYADKRPGGNDSTSTPTPAPTSTSTSTSNHDPSSGPHSPPSTREPGPACSGSACGQRSACFIAGTVVSTSMGLRPIESVAVGDLILSAEIETGAL